MVHTYKEVADAAKQEVCKAKSDAAEQVLQMQQELSDREKAVAAKEIRLNKIEADVEGEISIRVQRFITKKQKALDNDYKNKEKALDDKYNKMSSGYKTRYYLSLFYGILLTLIKAATSKVIRYEVIIFFKTLFNGLMIITQLSIDLGGCMAKVGDMIPQEYISLISHWLLQIITSGSIIVGVVILLCIGISKFGYVFKKYYADEVTVAFMLLILAVLVNYAD